MKTALSKENNNQVKARVYSDRYILNQLRVCRSRERLSVRTQQYRAVCWWPHKLPVFAYRLSFPYACIVLSATPTALFMVRDLLL